MGIVTITCPDTGEPVSTGIETDASSFGYIPRTEALFACPACGGRHPLSAAWLDEGEITEMKPQIAVA